MELADVDDDVNHIGAVNKPLVDVIVDGLLVGRLRRQQVDQAGAVHDCHLLKKWEGNEW